MLTREDLLQIRQIVRFETKSVVSSELKPIKTDISKIKRDLNAVIDFFDKAYLNLRKRVEKVEGILKISPS